MMKRYDKYKESGIPWIGAIPEHWEVKKIKYVFTERSEKGYPNEPILCSTQKYGVIPQSIYENRVVEVNKGQEGLKLVKEGNFVISLRSFQGGIEYAYYRGIISAAYTVLELNHDYNSEYMRHLLKSFPFIKLLQTCVTGIREGQNINYALLRKNFLPLPPLSEQEAIVAYLEEKVAKMDSLVAKQEAQIAYLQELKQAIIARAVTQGLDPQAPLRPSGIPWIGAIPKHWEEVKMRKIIDFFSDKGFPDETLLSVVRDQGVIIRDTESKEENHNYIPNDLSGYKRVQQGDFVINKMKAWQGSYAVSDYQGIVSPAYYTCKLRIPNKVFFNLAIRSMVYIPFFTKYSKGIRVDQWDLTPIGLKNIPFFLPPLSEQEAIVAYINRKTEEIDRLIAMTEQEIARVRELKQTLIADVVTGRINVQPS